MRDKGFFRGQTTHKTTPRREVFEGQIREPKGPKVKGEVMKNYVRVETKEVELLGIRTEASIVVDQREGEYTKLKHFCKNCDEDLTEELDKDINYCPSCGQDLVRGEMPMYSRGPIDVDIEQTKVIRKKL